MRPPPPAGWTDEPDEPDRLRQPIGLQNLLLGLGTALIAVAVIVFTAVNWSQLDAGIQGLILVAVTALAAVAAAWSAKRSMPSTAEALGLVAMLLAIADVHAFRVSLAPAADALAYWAGGLALVSSLSWTLGRAGRIRSPQVAAAVLGQAPLLFVLASAEVGVALGQLAVVAQATAVLLVAVRGTAPRWVRIAGTAWALVAVGVMTAAVVVDTARIAAFGEAGDDAHLAATGLSLAAAAVLALVVAWQRAESAVARTFALLGATSMGLGAVWFGGLAFTSGDVALALVALAAAVVLLVGGAMPKAWGEVPAVVGGVTVAVATVPVLGAVSSLLVAASTISVEAWALSGSAEAADLQLRTAEVPGSTALVLSLAAWIIVAAAARRAFRQVTGIVAAIVGLAVLTVSPLLVPLTIDATVLVALMAVLVGAVLALAVGPRRPASYAAIGFCVAAYAWATPWSVATPGLTFATLVAGIVAAVAISVAALHNDLAEVGAGAALWAAAAGPLLAGLAAWDGGTSVAGSWAVAATSASIASMIGVLLLDPVGRAARTPKLMAGAIEAVSLVVYLGALAVTASLGDLRAASLALAVGVFGFGLHAVRPHRRLASLVAAAEALAFIWLQLGQADVQAVEAYTLPLALVLLVVATVADRLDVSSDADRPSWITYGPALLVAFVPTVWLSFVEPGIGRPLVGLVAGSLVLIGGAAGGKRALVDVGAAVVVVLGLRQLAPVVGAMPNWATIGATGVVLLAVGATFEQRRRDLKAAARKYSELS